MPYGYNGKILHVDLTKGELTVEEPEEAFYRKYLGGSAMGMHYILREMPKGADPLGPDNVLTLMASVTTGAAISGQSRINANAKSPISGGIGDSQGGGFFPAELKFAGFDGIVIKGKSPTPVYLVIMDGRAELRDAAHLMGKRRVKWMTLFTVRWTRKRKYSSTGPRQKKACCSPRSYPCPTATTAAPAWGL